MMSSNRPDLDQTIQVLMDIRTGSSLSHPQKVSEVYLALIGLLYHLRVDQDKLRTASKSGATSIPDPSSIPAISAVLNNYSLFHALITCLSPSSIGDNDSSDVGSHGSSAIARSVLSGRKRAGSLDGFTDATITPAAKNFKLSQQSPSIVSSKRSIAPQSQQSPILPLKQTVATILMLTLEHLDHWPAPLVKAYADDCFGPRHWVDEEICSDLVENLKLLHESDGQEDEEMLDEEKETVSRQISDFYALQQEQYQLSQGNRSAQSPTPPPPHHYQHLPQRRGSLSSINSQSSANQHHQALPVLMRGRSDSVNSVNSGNSVEMVNSSAQHDEEESDSGDEEEEEIEQINQCALNRTASVDNGDSSSSGEEDEEIVMSSTRSFEGEVPSRSTPPGSVRSGLSDDLRPPSYPTTQQSLNFVRIRQRFFGQNKLHAAEAVASSLTDRLDVKSKQNSSLIQALSSFTSIPQVRQLITKNLEKWLQSPALSGLARHLFSVTVNHMRSIDPPLPADLEAITSIMTMRLKANQLNMHVENITSVAAKMPTNAVSKQIFTILLTQLHHSMDSADSTKSDNLKMIAAVNETLPKEVSAHGIAEALLALLSDSQEGSEVEISSKLQSNTQKLQATVRLLARHLGRSFDGLGIQQHIALSTGSQFSASIEYQERKACLMFQCITLLAQDSEESQPTNTSASSDDDDDDEKRLRATLVKSRKCFLKWFCSQYGPSFSDHKDDKIVASKNAKENVGAGTPDYSSVLDGLGHDSMPRWLEIIRCLLFLESVENPCFEAFLCPNPNNQGDEWLQEKNRISRCSKFAGDVDDEIIDIVLDSASRGIGGITPEIGLSILENLFEGCQKDKNGKLLVRDKNLIWKFYNLVEYSPPEHVKPKVDIESVEDSPGDSPDREIPKLAYSGMWWRVTFLGLILCGASPEDIGAHGWAEHPTLRALIKMVTSDRFRFPTVDCDDEERDLMKKTEQAMRDDESRITEVLFFPKKAKQKKEKEVRVDSIYNGSRVSKRQRDKREKLLKKQREKEAAEELAEANKRKKLLRAAQKSILLFDLKRGARKPPRESADLLFSVNEMFGLADTFQRNTNPDFVLMTIGKTTRGAIERAYDWLIPIISRLPGTIERLPASASCFLLLRAYGAEDGEDRAKLQELSAPLLSHVRGSLNGDFGEADAARAFDLLFTDVSSRNPERRRSARRVLQDAIGESSEPPPGDTTVFHNSNNTWMINLSKVQHADLILSDAIKHMARAATFERGKTLRVYVLALERLMQLAMGGKNPNELNFSSFLTGLISDRPTIFASAISTYPDLRSLTVRVVYELLISYTEEKKSDPSTSLNNVSQDQSVLLNLSPKDSSSGESSMKIELPLSLLQSISVLLSTWVEDSLKTEAKECNTGQTKILEIVEMLLSQNGKESLSGLASARFATSEISALPVESWVMLARSRSDFIAKRAALTAPTNFLPRLLLCSGLPRASLLTMINRLGVLGDKSQDKNKIFGQLLVPSAASEWDIGRCGHRREVARKLLGRLSAYSTLYGIASSEDGSDISWTFLTWLSEFCHDKSRPIHSKPKKSKNSIDESKMSIDFALSLSKKLFEETDLYSSSQDIILAPDESDQELLVFRNVGASNVAFAPVGDFDIGSTTKFIDEAIENNDAVSLQEYLKEKYSEKVFPPPPQKRRRMDNGGKKANASQTESLEIATVLLQGYSKLKRKPDALTTCVLIWTPLFSRTMGSPEFWSLIFGANNNIPPSRLSALATRCSSCWSPDHVINCRDWIISRPDFSVLNLKISVRFIIETSTQPSVDNESFSGIAATREDLKWGMTEDFVAKVTTLALMHLEKTDSSTKGHLSVCERKGYPDSLALILMLGRCGRKQMQFVCQSIVKRMETSAPDLRSVLLCVILRLYASFPASMNLGVAVLRSFLKEAVEKYSNEWLLWSSPLDDQFQDLIDSITENSGPPKLIQALSESSKKHPLLLLRKLDVFEKILELDAIAETETPQLKNRGVVFGKSLDGPRAAKMDKKVILNVHIRHWGFNYTEGIWLGFLEVIATVPNEVLFSCGLKMGLLKFLGVFLRLTLVQSELRSSERLGRLKEKLSEFFDAFKSTNPEGWENWLADTKSHGMTSFGSTRNVLMSSGFISHQEALDSLQKSKQ